MKTLLIEIPENKTLKEVKTLLADNGINIVIENNEKIIKTAKTKSHKTEKIPNARLKKSIDDAIKGKVFRANSVEDLFRQLNE